ncbi:prepilin peptidase [Neobacillus sp. YIM B02564]|uniref:Prepilin peptidase n=1 Tax=Neobacillus paridis TaxID=2803862 RepID=A0ABS1TLJ4_9BACI|nr:prepilin peptidase [Neobacillus paridis]MBL4952122.1 prepilin peptidase [Neobacillus paridis]
MTFIFGYAVPLGLLLSLGISGISVYTDIKERKIPNVLIGIGLLVGCITQLSLYGPSGLWEGVLGLLTAFFLTILFYILGGLGAGDVKLLMVIGLLSDPLTVFSVFFWVAMTGGVLSIAMMLLSKKGFQSWKNFKHFFLSLLYLKQVPRFDETKSVTLPYAIPIFLGVLIVVIIGNLEFSLPVFW